MQRRMAGRGSNHGGKSETEDRQSKMGDMTGRGGCNARCSTFSNCVGDWKKGDGDGEDDAWLHLSIEASFSV
jgi:hypothetical protein